MKANLLLTGICLAAAASTASAAPGLDIAWVGATNASRCPLSFAALGDVTDLCDTNDGLREFSMAFKAPAGISKLVGQIFVLDVVTQSNVLPDWWHLEDRYNPGAVLPGCRGGDPLTGKTSSFHFSTSRGSATTVTCKDYWQGAQPGVLAWALGQNGMDATRLYGTFAIDSTRAGPLTPNVAYFVGTGSFDTNHALADPLAIPPVAACGGCQIPACIAFASLLLQQPLGTPGGDVLITNGDLRDFMTWQGGGPSSRCGGYVDQSRRSTWGQVKSMYR